MELISTPTSEQGNESVMGHSSDGLVFSERDSTSRRVRDWGDRLSALLQLADVHGIEVVLPLQNARRAGARQVLVVLASCFVAGWAGSAAAQTVFFVVSERAEVCAHCDSFLLPLSDPQDIADARLLIANGLRSGIGSIPVVEVAAGADGVNRDPGAPGEPIWGWHVTDFQGFAEVAIELCDGWPGLIESDPHAFVANTGGQFCPWSYSVTAELTAPPPVPGLSSWGLAGLVLALSMVGNDIAHRASFSWRHSG